MPETPAHRWARVCQGAVPRAQWRQRVPYCETCRRLHDQGHPTSWRAALLAVADDPCRRAGGLGREEDTHHAIVERRIDRIRDSRFARGTNDAAADNMAARRALEPGRWAIGNVRRPRAHLYCESRWRCCIDVARCTHFNTRWVMVCACGAWSAPCGADSARWWSCKQSLRRFARSENC